jgi:hypothetical protein
LKARGGPVAAEASLNTAASIAEAIKLYNISINMGEQVLETMCGSDNLTANT